MEKVTFTFTLMIMQDYKGFCRRFTTEIPYHTLLQKKKMPFNFLFYMIICPRYTEAYFNFSFGCEIK